MRRTKIICTIGPSSQDEDMLRKIILAGMNVARFNFSHGDYEEHGLKLERTRKISRELNLPVAVLLDTRGPEIRLRDFAEGKVELKAGQKFTLTTEEIMGTAERATITYKNLPQENGSMSGKLSAIRKQIFRQKQRITAGCFTMHSSWLPKSEIGRKSWKSWRSSFAEKKSSSQRKPGAVSCR